MEEHILLYFRTEQNILLYSVSMIKIHPYSGMARNFSSYCDLIGRAVRTTINIMYKNCPMLVQFAVRE